MQVRDYNRSNWFKNRRSLFRLLINALLLISLALSLLSLLQQLFTDSLTGSYFYPLTLSLLVIQYFVHRIHLSWGGAVAFLTMGAGSISLALVSDDIALAYLSGALLPVLLRFVLAQKWVLLFIPIWLSLLLFIHSYRVQEELISELYTHLITLSYSLLVYGSVAVLFNRIYSLVFYKECKENSDLTSEFIDNYQIHQHFDWLKNKNPDGVVRVYGVYIKNILDSVGKSSESSIEFKESVTQFNQLLREVCPAGASIGRLDNGVYVLMSERRFWDAFERGLRQLKKEATDLSPIVVSTDTPNDSTDLDSALHNLDTVFVRATKEKTDFARFNLKDRDHLNGQTDIQSYEVSQAFANHEIQMFFQPKVDIKDNNRLVGAEALVRWIHPEKGLLTPKDFVDLLESSPYRLTFINSVVEQSAHFCETMKQSGLPISVSFNLSANDLQDLRVTYELSQVQEKYGFSAGELQIELSEQETDVSLDNLKRSLDAVKELGYSIALDDFGTGMSSLAYFQNLPADTIKLDRAFIKDIHLNPSSEHLTKMVVYLSKAEGLTVVAEGVENASEADRLLKLGVDQVQGFLFGKPMPANEFLQYYGLELIEDDV